MKPLKQTSTGLAGLDAVINHLRKGDNIVWQVDDIEDYRRFVTPYVEHAIATGERVIYLRFAQHAPVVDNPAVKVCHLDAASGFESFTSELHTIIKHEGIGAYYVFDCLSDLLNAWASDLMIGNFFVVTCPYLFELDTLAYFALLRNSHSFKTIARIRETTQLLLDVHVWGKNVYVHPLKVWNRYSPTMYLPHHQQGDEFVPMTASVDATTLFSRIAAKDAESARRYLDHWDRLFLSAAELLDLGDNAPERRAMVDRLCRIMICREQRMLGLATTHLTLEDVLAIKERVIGTGYVGGKAVGMLLARKMLLNDKSRAWGEMLEPHDSYYIGSDVFYTYLVQNGWWRMRMQQKTKEGYFPVAAALREQMLTGKFPEEIREQFQQIIEYFGQSPIIVRSSSLLEDSFGNAFAGKYESIFLANQGNPEERFAQFEEAVRQIYASTMNEDALSYRLQRGLADLDEQMALLVQRVSGAQHERYFFPELAGVGISYNTFVWKEGMDPKAGMLRLVFGLGTRAVNRVDGDYPRIIALDDPLRRPFAGVEDERKYSQHEVDALDLTSNQLLAVPFGELLETVTDLPLSLFATRDHEAVQHYAERGIRKECWILSFEELLTTTDFVSLMSQILKVLEQCYNYPVDIEFAANHACDGTLHINLLQCRPLQARGPGGTVVMPTAVPAKRVLFASPGNFMGGNITQDIARIIYVASDEYGALSTTQKYDVARLVGALNKMVASKEATPLLLIGPGRWGTSTPSLGVPVSFAEINNATAMVELAHTKGDVMPELSFGTHFFQDLVESNIFYVAVFPDRKGVVFNQAALDAMPNRLTALIPSAAAYEHVVKVCESGGPVAHIYSDIIAQKVICTLGA